MFKKAFAIKIGTSKKDKRLAQVIKDISRFYPELTVEGMNKKYRPEKITAVKSATILPTIGAILDVEKEEKTLLCFGVSKKFNVSFETDKATKLFGVQVIKVLDVKKDYKAILKEIGKYLARTFPVQSAINTANGFDEPEVIVRYSHYVSVNGVPVSYTDFKKRKAPKKIAKKDIVSSIINLLINQ